MATVASATIPGSESETWPAPAATMTLGGAGEALRIAADDNDARQISDRAQERDASLLSRVDLTEIPEPPVYMLLGLGLLVCAQRVLRRRRSAR